MVTHDPLASSYCNRVIFLKDGRVFSELYQGEKTREYFFKDILDMQAVLGGVARNDYKEISDSQHAKEHQNVLSLFFLDDFQYKFVFYLCYPAE